ncbi:hypothetical protein ABPG72_019546 [Tetrahymena utriculariae]
MLQVVKSTDCSTYTLQQQCQSNKDCSWQNDITKDKCLNLNQNCEDLSSNPQLCLTTPGCQSFPGKAGFCNQKASLGCDQLSSNDCLKNTNCIWTSIQDCESQDQGFGCQGFNEEYCNQNFDFCQSNYICKDIDGQKCQNLAKQDCLTANNYCTYQSVVQESCSYNKEFCEKLSSDDCLGNSDFCLFVQTSPFTCADNDSTNICAQKTIEDCLLSSKYCTLSCTQAIQCSNFKNESDCINNKCNYDDQQQDCSSPVDCTTLLDLNDCKNNPLCTPNCQNNLTFNCSSKSMIDCKLNQQYCFYTPPEGKCSSNGMCSNLAGYECQFYQSQCLYTPEQGTCTIKSDLGCQLKSRMDCVSFPYCISVFSSCQDIQGDVCSVINRNECSLQGSKCQVSQQGYCSDSIIECPTDNDSCQSSQYCEWVGQVQDSCSASLDCTTFSSADCQNSSDVCTYIAGGQQNLNQILFKPNMNFFQIFCLNLISVFVRCDQCSSIQTQDSCSQSTGCKWVENNSNIFCTNKDFGCSKLDQKTCMNNVNCYYQDPLSGGCQLDRSTYCNNLSYIQCQYLGQRCSWQSTFNCENFSDGFNCSSKNQQQCINSSNYCNSQFQCLGSKDQTLCSIKNKSDCLAASSYCQYSVMTPQSCSDLASYCKNLSGPDCLADSNFCSFQQVTPSSCTNKSDASICGKLSLSDCANASQFCYSIQTPYTCTNKVTNATCGNLLDQSSCTQNSGCTWVNNICSTIIDCTALTQQLCESQQKSTICTSNPSQTVCQNKSDFGCTQYNSQSSLCQQYSSYCSYQQFTGNCSTKNNCQNFKQSDCLSASNKCVFQPEIGSCQLSSNINCNSLNQAACQSTSYCVYQFLSCSDLNQDICSTFSLDQCTANNIFCEVSIQGTCQDNKQLNCSKYSQQNCSQNQGCLYYNDTPESCSNLINCSKLSQRDCKDKSQSCIYSSQSGVCSTDQSQVVQKSSIILKTNSFIFLLSMILFL